MLSLGDSNSPFSFTGAEAEAWSTAAVVLIMLTTAPFGLSFAIGCWRPSTSDTVPRIEVLQPDKRRTARASALIVIFFLPWTARGGYQRARGASVAKFADVYIGCAATKRCRPATTPRAVLPSMDQRFLLPSRLGRAIQRTMIRTSRTAANAIPGCRAAPCGTPRAGRRRRRRA